MSTTTLSDARLPASRGWRTSVRRIYVYGLTKTAFRANQQHHGTGALPPPRWAGHQQRNRPRLPARAGVRPKHGQFLSIEPLVSATHKLYVYAGDSPLNYRDRSGLGIEEIFEGGSGIPCPWCSAAEGVAEALEGAYREAQHGVEWLNSQVGAEELGDPAEQGAGAAQKGCELLENDGTGRVDGELPSCPPPEWTEEDLEQVAEDLREEIASLLDWMLAIERESGENDEITSRLKGPHRLERLFAVIAAARIYTRNPHYLQFAASLGESDEQSLAASELAWISKLQEQAQRRRERADRSSG